MEFISENISDHGFPFDFNHTDGNLSAIDYDDADLKFQRIISILHVYVLPVIILIGIVGNTVSFLIYIGTPRLCRQSSSVYLAFLAAVDNIFLVTLFTVWVSWVGIHTFHKEGWCQTILYCINVCSFLSVWTVVSFTCERWIVVFLPLKRHRLCTRKRAIIVMTSLTVSALAFYLYSIFTTGVRHHSSNDIPVCAQPRKYHSLLQVLRSIDTMVTIIIPLVAIVIMNTGIGIKTCRYTNKSKPVRAPPDSVDEMFSNLSSLTRRNSELRNGGQPGSAGSMASHQSRYTINNSNQPRQWRFFTRRQQTQLRITRALLIVSTVFILLNLPSYAFRIHGFIIGLRQEVLDTSMQAFIWQEFIQFVYYMNFSSNFFLYCACSRNFRFALKRLLCRFRRRLMKLRNLSRRARRIPEMLDRKT